MTEAERLEIREGVRHVLTRWEAARAKLVEACARQGELSPEDAELAASELLARKVAKLDPIVGQFTVKHGAFLEKDVLARAVEFAKERR